MFTAPQHQTSSKPCHPMDTANMEERTDTEEAALDTGNGHQTSEDSGFNTRTTADGVVLEVSSLFFIFWLRLLFVK